MPDPVKSSASPPTARRRNQGTPVPSPPVGTRRIVKPEAQPRNQFPKADDTNAAPERIDFPIYTSVTKLDPVKMGVNEQIYPKIGRAAADTGSVIFIRKTSAGSVLPFATASAVGKKLVTKGKSSLSYFTSGTIPFFASLSKKIGDLLAEQNTLIEVTKGVKGEQKETTEIKDLKIKKYAYIPKLIAIDDKLIKNDKEGYQAELEVQEGKNGLFIKVLNDRFGEKKGISVEYYLKKIDFEENTNILKCNDFDVAEPAFLKRLRKKKEEVENTKLEGYQVFIKKDSIYSTDTFKAIKELWQYEVANIDKDGKDKAPNSELVTEKERLNISFEEGDKLKPKRQEDEIDDKKDLWDYYWSNYKKFQAGSYLDDDINPLDKFCKPVTIRKDRNSSIYYPVNVLGLFTRGTISEKDKTQQTPATEKDDIKSLKKYYEVVADYDVFMIAPSIEVLQNQMKLVVQDNKTNDEIYFENYSNGETLERYKKRFIPRADGNRTETPTQTKAKHGVTSDYERIEVRRAMNVNMGINSVQHGTEVANVFHISDIQEPVMMFSPHAKELGSDLFFLNLELLFRLFNPVSNSEKLESYRPGKQSNKLVGTKTVIEYDPDYEVDITFPSYNKLAQDYALLFNLNWGTDYYLNLVAPSKGKEQFLKKEKKYFAELIAQLETLVFSSSSKAKFGNIKPLVIPDNYETTSGYKLADLNVLREKIKQEKNIKEKRKLKAQYNIPILQWKINNAKKEMETSGITPETKKRIDRRINRYSSDKDHLNALIQSKENRGNFDELFGSYSTSPPPVQAFALFLYQNYKLYLASKAVGQDDETLRKFLTKLLFWGYYYLAIFEECSVFAPKVGINPNDSDSNKRAKAIEKIKSVQENYQGALKVISALIGKMSTSFEVSMNEILEGIKMLNENNEIEMPQDASGGRMRTIIVTNMVGRIEKLNKELRGLESKRDALKRLQGHLIEKIGIVDLPFLPKKG